MRTSVNKDSFLAHFAITGRYCIPVIAATTSIMLVLSACAPAPDNGSATPSSRAAAMVEDYLDSDLRESVESLKEAVDTRPVPATDETLEKRALTLYKWGNAYARAGNELPPLLPSTSAQVIHAIYEADEITPTLLEQGADRINNYISQMILRDEQPNALGKVEMLDRGPFPSESWQTVRQRYIVGNKPMEVGATLLVAPHSGSGTELQGDDPAADNYTSVSSSNPDVEFAVEKEPRSRWFVLSRALVFRITKGTLEPGDTVTFTYGDKSGGSRGIQMQALSNDKVPFMFLVSFEPDATTHTVSVQGLQVEGGPVARVHGFAPSIVTPGEPFSMTVRSEDQYTNRATGNIPAYTVFLNGEEFRKLPSGTSGLQRIENISLESPGVHRFTIKSDDGEIEGAINPIVVREDPAQRVFWGETHGHSGMAEGMGTSDAFFEFGRDDALLDFLVHSEHDLWMDDSEWEELRANTKSFYEKGEFITYLGYEWTVPQTLGGHHNVVFRTPDNRQRVPRQTHPMLSQLYKGLREGNADEDVLVIPHAHQAGDWRQSNPAVERLVEIQSYHGMFEWFGHMYLRKGHHVGFIAASDDHRAHPGYGVRSGLAAVMAPEKSRDAIFDAMRDLKTYAVTGDRIVLDMNVNGTGMGQYAPFAETRQIEANVVGTAPIDMLVLKRNSTEIKRWDFRTLTETSMGKSPTIEIAFQSSSATLYDMRDNPRSERTWSGTIEVEGARLLSASGPGFLASDQHYEVDGNTVRFRTVTRGSISRLILELEDATPATRIEFSLEQGVERPGGHTRTRGRVPYPAWQPTFSLEDLDDGRARRSQNVEGYADTVTLRRVRNQAPMEQSISFTDDSARHGDYYTLRVEQANDSLAWSSPIWVGGNPPR